MFVYIKPLFVNAIRRTAAMLFHVHRIHVAVFVKRKREPFEGAFRIVKRVVVTECFIVELQCHISGPIPVFCPQIGRRKA